MKEGFCAAIDKRDNMTVYSKFTVTFSRNVYRPIAVTACLAKNRVGTGAIRVAVKLTAVYWHLESLF